MRDRHKEATPETKPELAEEAMPSVADSAARPSHMPEGLSEDEQTAWWLKNVYCADRVPQLTLRAVVTGLLIGALMSISNLYVGLKTGWGLGVTITAAVIAYAVFKSLEAVLPAVRGNPLSMLENCTVLSTAAAAGAISSAGLVSAIPALYFCTGRPLAAWQIIAWLACVATLGCFMAVPLKRQLINIDKLPFPSGTATAETLRSLHATGAKAMQQAKTLLWCGVFGVAVKFWAEAWADLCHWLGDKWRWLAGFAPPYSYPLLPTDFAGKILQRYSIGFEPSTIMVAAGAIMGIRIGVSLLAGMLIFFGILAPCLDAAGIIHIEPGPKAFRGITAWTLWPAVAMMVTAGLTNFALRWRMIGRALGEMRTIFGGRQKDASASASVELPTTWFVFGVTLAGAACVYLGMSFFGIAWWMGVLAVLLTFVLSIVAARATGETDVTPIGAMGKITQLTYGVVDPGNMKTNLMTAAITAGAASHSAELLQSLKTGYLVGANPRKQTLAQLCGIMAGVLICVPVFTIIVRMPPFDPAAQARPAAQPSSADTAADADDPNKTNLFTNQFAAPAVAVWLNVARILAEGVRNLPKGSVIGMAIGGLLGILIALLEEFLPRRYVKWIPSATGLGLAGVITPQNSISMFLGALLGWLWMKKYPQSCEDYMISGASGLIAGESLTGVGVNLVRAAPTIGPQIWQSLRTLLGG